MWDFMIEWILPIITMIFLLMMIFVLGVIIFLGIQNENKNLSYVKNLETKLNIYEQSYNNSVLEDSLSQ